MRRRVLPEERVRPPPSGEVLVAARAGHDFHCALGWVLTLCGLLAGRPAARPRRPRTGPTAGARIRERRHDSAAPAPKIAIAFPSGVCYRRCHSTTPTMPARPAKPLVYLETSFISYLTAPFSADEKIARDQVASRRWWDEKSPKVRSDGLVRGLEGNCRRRSSKSHGSEIRHSRYSFGCFYRGGISTVRIAPKSPCASGEFIDRCLAHCAGGSLWCRHSADVELPAHRKSRHSSENGRDDRFRRISLSGAGNTRPTFGGPK